ncbi:MAG: hypothetical protein K6F00_04805, partial [Lachnospiraceae bacterium]|nr:hypothetical protein [Lachnospiraceae bacterium]
MDDAVSKTKEIYSNIGISEKILEFGNKTEVRLKDRFDRIDMIAEANSLKVIYAMQKAKVSA